MNEYESGRTITQAEQWPYQAEEDARRPDVAMESKMMSRSHRREKAFRDRLIAITLVSCMVIGLLFGFAGSYAYDVYKNAGVGSAENENVETQVLYQSVARPISTVSGSDAIMSVEEAAAAVRQVVVEIMTETKANDWRFGSYVSPGAGSGVIVTSEGYIVTNYHVIEGAENITVRLPEDGRTFQAKVVGADPDTDLAIIKIPVSGLTTAVLGDSSAMRVGQTALAVGNPLGELGGTVTAGIISALDREISIEGQVMTLLQTDAAVNRGNSGGGLFNLYGELIGVVNAKSSGTDIEGLGFAIPINSAKKVIQDLISFGYVKGRVSAGLEVVDVTSPRAAMRYGVSQIGLYIASSKDSQLQNGDRIVGVNDMEVIDLASFRSHLSKSNVGDTVRITVFRGDSKITANIVLTEMQP